METIKRIWASAPWWAWVIMIGGFSAVTIVLLVVDFPSASKMPYVDVL